VFDPDDSKGYPVEYEVSRVKIFLYMVEMTEESIPPLSNTVVLFFTGSNLFRVSMR